MSDNYTQRVFKEYKRRKEEGSLSLSLKEPTPGGLREECARVYIEKNKPTEDAALRSFFGVLNGEPDYLKLIEKFEIDLFRPLVSFLKGNVKEPNKKNIELLEWLMSNNLKPAYPFKVPFVAPTHNIDDELGAKKYQDEKLKPDTKLDVAKIETIPNKYTASTFLNIFTIAIVFLLLEAGALFLWRNYTDQIGVPSAEEKCMYWAGTHYEPIKCGELKDGVPVVPLNVKKLNTLKKIYLSDTLTGKSIGRVWYSNVGRKHEFFTDSGMHPVDTVKRLRPLTSYILTKHTSNHRFLVNVIKLVSCSIVITVLFAFGWVYLRRKLNKN